MSDRAPQLPRYIISTQQGGAASLLRTRGRWTGQGARHTQGTGTGTSTAGMQVALVPTRCLVGRTWQCGQTGGSPESSSRGRSGAHVPLLGRGAGRPCPGETSPGSCTRGRGSGSARGTGRHSGCGRSAGCPRTCGQGQAQTLRASGPGGLARGPGPSSPGESTPVPQRSALGPVQGLGVCAGAELVCRGDVGGGPRRPGQVTEPVGKPRAVELQTQRIALGAHLLWG